MPRKKPEKLLIPADRELSRDAMRAVRGIAGAMERAGVMARDHAVHTVLGWTDGDMEGRRMRGDEIRRREALRRRAVTMRAEIRAGREDWP